MILLIDKLVAGLIHDCCETATPAPALQPGSEIVPQILASWVYGLLLTRAGERITVPPVGGLFSE
jgi:hypothetical protein